MWCPKSGPGPVDFFLLETDTLIVTIPQRKGQEMTNLNEKTPVITGAATGTGPTAVLIGVTGGLGHALAKLLAAEGFRLVLAARREHDAAALTGRSDGSAIYLRADVTDPASLEKLAAAAFEHLGRIDAVV